MKSHSRLVLCGALTVSIVAATAYPVSAQEQPATATGIVDLDLEALLTIPLVASVSLHEQSLDESPSSVTVIREDEIRASGATNVIELLRLVPGMHVMQLTGNGYSVGLRGISRLVNDRVLILVDGHLYKEFVTGEARWVHVDPMDVERIEVIRGPGSVIYGAGALSGVVNIITKKPGANGTLDASSWGGVGTVKDVATGNLRLQSNGGARVVYNLENAAQTLGARVGVTTINLAEWPNADPAAGAADPGATLRGPHSYAVFANGRYRRSERLQMSADFFHTSDENISISDMSNVPTNLKTAMQQLAYRIDRKQLAERLDVSWSLTGRHSTGESPATTVQAMSYRTYSVDSMLTLGLGLFDGRNITTGAYQVTLAHAGGYFSSPTMFSNGVVLGNDTFFLRRKLVLSLSGRFDHISSRDDLFGEIVYRAPSYRGALLWHLAENHTLRLSGSSSFRVPTPYETFARVQPTAELANLPAGVPPIRFVVGNPQLVPEQVRNFELGYRGRLRSTVQADVAAFVQDVAHLIANDPSNALPVFKVNRFNYQQLGVEAGLRYYPTTAASAYLNYAFTYSRDKDSGEQSKEFPVHIGGLGGELRLPWRTRVNLDTYWVFAYAPNVTRLMPGAQVPVVLNENRSAPGQTYVNLRLGRLLYQDKVEVFVMGKNLLGFSRSAVDLRMYPSENVQPIGALVLAGLSLKGS